MATKRIGKEFFQSGGRVALALLAFASLAASVWLGINDKVPGGTLCGVLGLLLLAFVQLSRFKKFKGIGFEAELWEETQKEASALIDRTKELLGVLASAYMTTAPRMGRWDSSYSRRELYDLAARLEALLKDAGVPASAIEVQGELRHVIAGDLARPVAGALRKLIDERLQAAREEIKTRFGSPITDNAGHNAAVREMLAKHTGVPDYALIKITPPAELPALLRGWIAEAGLLTDTDRDALLATHADALADLEAWARDGTVRRPDVFFAHGIDD